MIPKVQKLIAVFWPSFLVAGLGTILIFTTLDPDEIITPVWIADMSHMEVYTLGFLFLWVLGILACYLTCYFQTPQDRICSSTSGCD